MVHNSIATYVQTHQEDFEFLAEEIPFNPYLRDGNGAQYSWRVVITYKPTNAQFRCHFSSDASTIDLMTVLDVLRNEIRALKEHPTPEEYAAHLGLPLNDAMDIRDARRVRGVAVRQRDMFLETFGTAAKYLLGYKETKEEDGIGFW